MSLLLDFYRGLGTDTEGRLLTDILAWPDAEFEEVHDFIQWRFPEPSQYNPDAPLLTKNAANCHLECLQIAFQGHLDRPGRPEHSPCH
jgi:hypothetical protein